MAAKQKKATSLTDITAYRRSMGNNQTKFWSHLGVTQSGGSRYESGRNIPLPVGILLVLEELGMVTAEQLDAARKIAEESPTCR